MIILDLVMGLVTFLSPDFRLKIKVTKGRCLMATCLKEGIIYYNHSLIIKLYHYIRLLAIEAEVPRFLLKNRQYYILIYQANRASRSGLLTNLGIPFFPYPTIFIIGRNEN